MLDEEDLTLLHGEDFSWFRRSVHFLLFFIGVAALLLLALLVLPRRYTSGASFENGFGVRIPLEFRRTDAPESAVTKNNTKWKNAKIKQLEAEFGSSSKNYKTSDQQKTTSLPGNHTKSTSLPSTTKPPISTTKTTNKIQPVTNSFAFPVFVRPQEAAKLECNAFFKPGANFNDYRRNRVKFRDPDNEAELPMDCDAIKKRAYFQTDDLYPEEREFPIAYTRAVFMVSFFELFYTRSS
jgi:hypothetical protein